MGERPDGALAAEMAANLIQTPPRRGEMDAGRNVFGFDVTFTPASPYKSSIAMNCDTNPAGDRGLWDAAKCAAEEAHGLQKTEVDDTRDSDRSQERLARRPRIRKNLDGEIEAASGIAAPTSGGDDATKKCTRTSRRRCPGCGRARGR